VTHEPIYVREGNLVLFNQRGVKIECPPELPIKRYDDWLDKETQTIGKYVSGAKMLEKVDDRLDPRKNTGVYYDSVDYALLDNHSVLRTTSNPKTHAFCAFKRGIDADGIRRDHRYVFDGPDKVTIQSGPTSDEAFEVVKRLLRRSDVDHPGRYLKEVTGLDGDELSRSVLLVQYRRTFYVLIDERDALRCSLDLVETSNLRIPEPRPTIRFNEVELAIFPRIDARTATDPRVDEAIAHLSQSVRSAFGGVMTLESKYRRAAGYLMVAT
jgi:hypothetical protein